MGRRWVDGIGSLTSAGAVNTSTATSRSAKIRANGPMCAAARGSSENGAARSDTQNSFSRAAAEINVLQSPPYFRADEDSFGRAPRDANWVSPRGGGSHFARRDPRGFDRERRLRAERQARPSGGHKEAESRGTFVRSRHGEQRARGPRARPSQQGVRGRAGVRRGVGTSHALQRHRLPRLWGGAEAPAQAHAGARCAPPIIDRAP